LVVLALAPAAAWPHAQYRPFSTNRFTEISFDYDSVCLAYTVTVGDIPAQRLKLRADDDRDGVLTAREIVPLGVWMHELLADGLTIELDGRAIEVDPGTAKIEMLSKKVMYGPMRFRFRWRVGCSPGRHRLLYHDRSRLPAIEQTEVFVRPEPGMRLVSVSRLPRDRNSTSRMFWESGAAPGPVSVRFELANEGSGEDHPNITALEDDAEPLKRALADQRLGFWELLAIIGFSFLLGAMHALAPGHGKTLVAAYLVGSQGKLRHAVLLGLIVTVTHVLSVVILGLVALWATQEVVPERVGPWIRLAAGGLVVGMGVWMTISRLRKKAVHDHVHVHEVKWTELVGLGVTGGMVPCLSATVVLLFAIYVGRILMGLFLIAAFSLGMAATLIVLGMLVVTGRALVARWSSDKKGKKWLEILPVLSAGVVTAIGLAMAISAALRL
jgi:ABC-type nickel/cobalt efflux system permease component RcnA